LSDIDGAQYHYYSYRWSPRRSLRLLYLLRSQWLLAMLILRRASPDDIIYVNTVLPFGAALAGRLRGCRVIYHVHETSLRPALLKWFLFTVLNRTASDVIYVSLHLQISEGGRCPREHILPNALGDDFLAKAVRSRRAKQQAARFLMICSLKAYKGVWEYVTLASSISQGQFRLVLNADQEDVDAFFAKATLPVNLQVYPTQVDVHPHYQWADVVLNLSRPDGWIETFGLTVIEGMAYGLPALVPPVGGIAELIQEGHNGYHVDSRDEIALRQTVLKLMQEVSHYRRMSMHTLQSVQQYRETTLLHKNLRLLHMPDRQPSMETLSS